MNRGRLVGAAIFVVVLASLMAGSRTQGNTRDEGYYFDAAELYYGWYGELGDNLLARAPARSFTRQAVDRWFGYNHEHPALMKTLFGFSWRLFHRCHCPEEGGLHSVPYRARHRTIPLLSDEGAMRFPAHVLVALMAVMVFSFAARAWSMGAGVVAAALAVLAPRLFFDAQLACFDAPIAALWVATVYAYWRALAEPRWRWRAGVLFGLALATKHNAFFLPMVLVAHWLWLVACAKRWAGSDVARSPRAGTVGAWLLGEAKRLPRVFFWMALLGPVVYFACWPWLWFDTIARFREYAAFHINHVYYNMEYMGRNYNQPPFPLSFPYVMTLLTLPATTLALALGGAAHLIVGWVRARARRGETDASLGDPSHAPGFLIGINALFPMAIITLTRAPIFGATKHFHATIPFLALLAGYGFHALLRALTDEPNARRRAAWALGILVCSPAVFETWRSHPYGLSHYNALAGGPAGGADLGMNRQFWGYATRGLLPWLNERARPGERVYWHDTNHAQLNMYVRDQLLRPDIADTGLEEPGVRASNLAMVIHEMHFNKYEYWIWDFYGTTRPARVLDEEGVPLVTLYERPRP